MKEITVTVFPQDEGNFQKIKTLIRSQLLPSERTTDFSFTLLKRSVDARHGKVKLHLRYAVVFADEAPLNQTLATLPEWKTADGSKSVVIVGSGPAGLFGALKLLEYGIKPIIIERGEETSQRKVSIAKLSTQHSVDPNSNYCFGEGGAGTFSDGKLYTRSNKRGDISQILRIFYHFGANESILTDAHPHIGTDKLPKIINAIRTFIIERGGEFHFNTLCTELLTEQNNVHGILCRNTQTQTEFSVNADAVMLSTGHSATDVYKMIARTAPAGLEAKTFAAGLRVEHPRSVIDQIQYHSAQEAARLGAAEYRFTTQQNGRGVYSFCMCPGGFVVPSATEPSQIVVNGMSAAKRNSAWSNAAVVVEIRPEDIPQEFVQQAKESGCTALAGLLWREHIEQLAFKNGNGQQAPAQLLTDFLQHEQSTIFPKTSYTPGICPSRIDQWLPPHIALRLESAFYEVNKSMKGYICPKALLIAPETRTSTPVRILRNKETCESPVIKNLFPCGEGAGYSGGIVSSAMDGQKVCSAIAKNMLS